MNGHRPCLLAGLAVLLFAGGCQRPNAPDSGPARDFKKLGSLPRLAGTHHGELRAEFSRLKAAGATPTLLDAAQSQLLDRSTSDNKWRADREDLDQVLDARSLSTALNRLDKLYPKAELKGGPIVVTNLMAFHDQFIGQRDAYREKLRTGGFKFTIPLSEGLMSDLSFVDHVRLSHRLEALTAQEWLIEGNPSGAMLPIRNLFRIEGDLARLYHVVPRLAAAQLRKETLAVVHAVVNHPACTATLQRQILQLLKTTLDDWPPDRRAWIADRAVGLHTYEMVRDGQLMSILTAQEIARLEARGELKGYRLALEKTIDSDEAFYLKTMRTLIDACKKPFYERGERFQEIETELDSLKDTAQYPLFAALILLPDLVSGQRRQAEDLARCRAWMVALGAALGTGDSDRHINPLTGRSFVPETTSTSVRLEPVEGEGGTAIVVPVLVGATDPPEHLTR